jgi:putative ABC transport system ATP-binding protein
MGKVIVCVQQLSKIYQRGTIRVISLSDINLEVHEGECLALMGPSGSGKTTLLNIIAGIDRPSFGLILVGGTDISALDEDELAAWRNREVGFVFQTFNLIPVLTAFENVELPLLLMDLSRRERRTHVETVLRLVGLADRMAHYPRQLSGGEEQRVAIARALVTDPTLILADEPTGDLDAKSAQGVLQVLARLNREFGKTVILVTHDSQAAKIATTTRHLDKGILLPIRDGDSDDTM